jgi:ribonucleoside-diphosphate reductase alpha chain
LNTARDIDYIDRVHMQAAWQKYIDASISSTVNLPESATVEDIEDLYMEAYKCGLKGITVYRDNCMRTAILTDTSSSKKASEEPENNEEPVDKEIETVSGHTWGYVIPSGDDEIGMKRKIVTGCGNMHCIAFFDKDTHDLREVYLNKGSSGGCNNFMIGFSRLLSTCARAGVSIDNILDQLESTGVCPSYAKRTAIFHDTSSGSCCPMAVGRAIKDMIEELQKNETDTTNTNSASNPNIDIKSSESDDTFSIPDAAGEVIIHRNKKTGSISAEVVRKWPKHDYLNNAVCPECGEMPIFEGGCASCKNCGWTKCY